MSNNKKQSSGGAGASGNNNLPANLPENFFDTNKKSKKAQEDELAKELEQFEKEMAALQAESEEQLKEEFDKLQDEKNLDELDQQLDQWKRIVELEKRAEELKNKPLSENPAKKFKRDTVKPNKARQVDIEDDEGDYNDLDSVEDFEDKLFDWRSKKL